LAALGDASGFNEKIAASALLISAGSYVFNSN
jgi:hypothetical protein